jgi:pyruvate kinase
MIGQLMDAGVSVIRLNFSHGTHEAHAENIARIRELAHARDRMVPIMGDLQGPKIRVGQLEGDQSVEIRKGATLRLMSVPKPGNAEAVSVDYPHLAQDVGVGHRILIDDGAIELKVSAIDGHDVVCDVIIGGTLKERKGVNVPGSSLRMPSITDKDKEDLRFALEQKVDFIALSFVRQAKDVQMLKNIIEWANGDAHVIAKLEKPQALEHLAEILEVADGVMVARGDLGVELSPWQVPVAQKNIIREAAKFRKPVITATQMLQSMIENATPTRAEASDVANAVFDGSDALMLSGETAVGKYPVESVLMMSRIIETAEAEVADVPFTLGRPQGDVVETSSAVAAAAAQLCERLGAKYLVVYTESGYTARLVSKHRPRCSILALSRHPAICHRVKLLWGVRSKPVQEVDDIDHLVMVTENMLLENGWVERGDVICLIAGTPFEIGGKTDTIKLHKIGDAVTVGGHR